MSALTLGNTFVSKPNSQVNLISTGLPVIIPSSGTVATNGTITLTTALPTIYSDSFIYLPAGAVVGGAAGLYYAEFSSTTVGQVYTNPRSAVSVDFVPDADAADLHTTLAVGSNSAYTQTTAADLAVTRESIPGGLMGTTGQVLIKCLISTPTNANNKTPKILFGSTAIHTSVITTSLTNNIDKELTNRGVTNKQVGNPLASSGHGASASAAVYATEETKVDVPLKFTGQLAVATDYMVFEYINVVVVGS